MTRRLRQRFPSPQEIAPGIHYVEVGKALQRSNVYFITAGSTWCLIDTGSADCASGIVQAAASLFERQAPEGIFLTHDHPDHGGSARELAERWGCPVWVHPDEMPLTRGDLSAVRLYANPLDRWVILPVLRLLGALRTQEIVARSSLEGVVRPLALAAELPGLPGWEAVSTPGHTPGHVAFFRSSDRVVIAGDALVTVPMNSWRVFLKGRQEVSLPPWFTTWDRERAGRSVEAMAALEPRVLGGGHGQPMAGPDIAARIGALKRE